jgi:hypothetical protein
MFIAQSMRSLMFQMSLVLLLIAAVLTAVDIPRFPLFLVLPILPPLLLMTSLLILVISTCLLPRSYWHPC